VPWRTIAAGTVPAGLLGATIGPTPLLPVLLPAVVLGVLLAAIDLRCLRLPDPLVGALAVLTVPPLVALAGPGQLLRAVLAAGLSGTAYAVLAILPRGGLGFGDVKLAAVLGFVLGFLGWPALAAGLLLPHLINGPIALFLLIRGKVERRTAVPLGPALLIGALLGVAAAG
jgi:leader peptidase (prepilin peptidase)/N-methyltransferase